MLLLRSCQGISIPTNDTHTFCSTIFLLMLTMVFNLPHKPYFAYLKKYEFIYIGQKISLMFEENLYYII